MLPGLALVRALPHLRQCPAASGPDRGRRPAGRPDLLDCGLTALDWYLDQCRRGDELRLIGNQWRAQGELPGPDGDEQPVDATAVVEAALEAWRATGRIGYRDAATIAFTWFLGRNRLGVPLYDAASGGGHDGLSTTGLNDNQGAESTLAFWQAALAMEQAGLHELNIQS